MKNFILTSFTLCLISCNASNNQNDFNTPKEELPTIINDTINDYHPDNNTIETFIDEDGNIIEVDFTQIDRAGYSE